jgi:hypothetical protein
MTILTTLTAGTNTGPFDLYQNSNGYVTPFATGVPRIDLVSGYNSIVDDATTVIRVKSTGICDTQVDIGISGIPGTTTTTSTSTSTTSTTTTVIPVITLSFQPFDKSWTIQSTVPVPQSVFVGATTVDGFTANSCITQIAGATINGGFLGLNVGEMVDTQSSTGYSGPWGTTTPYRFNTVTLDVNGVSIGIVTNGSTITISGIVFTVYLYQTCL